MSPIGRVSRFYLQEHEGIGIGTLSRRGDNETDQTLFVHECRKTKHRALAAERGSRRSAEPRRLRRWTRTGAGGRPASADIPGRVMRITGPAPDCTVGHGSRYPRPMV